MEWNQQRLDRSFRHNMFTAGYVAITVEHIQAHRFRSHTSGRFPFLFLIAIYVFTCWPCQSVDAAGAGKVHKMAFSESAASSTAGDGPNASIEKVKADAEMVKAEAEVKKVEVERLKAMNANWQFYFEWAYKVLLLVGAFAVLVWVFPQIQELSIPWGAGTATLKRAPKEPAAPPNAPDEALFEASAMEHVKKGLMEAPGVPARAAEGIIANLEERELYKGLGIAMDSIYICHRAQKLPRSDYYQVQVYLDADEPSTLEKIAQVTYLLHPTFSDRERTLTKNGEGFKLQLTAWGEFMLYARVYFKDQPKPIQLKRYLNF